MGNGSGDSVCLSVLLYLLPSFFFFFLSSFLCRGRGVESVASRVLSIPRSSPSTSPSKMMTSVLGALRFATGASLLRKREMKSLLLLLFLVLVVRPSLPTHKRTRDTGSDLIAGGSSALAYHHHHYHYYYYHTTSITPSSNVFYLTFESFVCLFLRRL
jgi:hypothetical protein